MVWTLCTSGSPIIRAGLNADATLIANDTAMDQFSYDAEGEIVSQLRWDVVNDYSALTSGSQLALASVCSKIIAKSIIGYDVDGYGSRTAGLMLDMYTDDINKEMNELKKIDFDEIRDVP